MDELEISGKRYISSKRAGKEHKYHPDYIGQLVRAGKVEGQKVGRAWYVDADSLSFYLSKDLGPREPVLADPGELVQKAEEEKTNEDTQIEPEPEPVSEPQPIAVHVQKEEMPEMNETTSIQEEIKIIPIKVAKPRIGGLTYLVDEEPLFPAIKKHAVPMTTTPMMARTPVTISKENSTRILLAAKPKTKKRVSLVRPGLMLLALGCSTFAIVALLSSNVIQTTVVGGGQIASIQYSLK
ncbi:MAG: hypothetical protein KGH79_04715 [Patescibacteria group bacterium]|nr:hypothetical protein [Patescibacteria group bacterium]